MDPRENISLEFDQNTKVLLTELVRHREEILDQLRYNFGEVRQHPCFGTGNEVHGFEITLNDLYINEDGEYNVLLQFKKRRYGMQIKIAADRKIPVFLWMYWERDMTILKSRKFIETVYRFLNNYKTIQPREADKVVNGEDIRKYWDTLINEISQSI